MTAPELLRRRPWRRASPHLKAARRKVNRVNDWLALHITAIVGTMWCFYVFNGLALTSAPAAIATHSPTAIINWVSSNWIQLILLPALMVGQNLAAQRTEAAILDTHRLAVAEHEQTRTVLADLADAHRDTHELLTAVHGIVPDLKAVLTAVGAVGAVLADTPESGDGTAKA